MNFSFPSKRLLVAVDLLLAFLIVAVPSGAANVSLHRDAAVYHVTGEFDAFAKPAVAWDVITDYAGVGRFVSSVRESRVVRRDPDAVLIEQEAVGSLLFFSRSIRLALLVRELPPSHVEFEQVGTSPFALYEGSWRIEPNGAGCRVTYELAVDPGEFAGPAFIAKAVLIRNISRQLDDVQAEIERRADAARYGKD